MSIYRPVTCLFVLLQFGDIFVNVEIKKKTNNGNNVKTILQLNIIFQIDLIYIIWLI